MRSLKNKKILITGGAGFVGSHLAEKLLGYECQINILDLVKSKVDNIECIQQDLKKFLRNNGLKRGNYDYIFHLAGFSSVKSSITHPRLDFELNLENSFLMLENIRQLKNKPLIIFASSAAVYGIPKKWPATEETPATPLSPYGVSKLAIEKYLKVYSYLYKIPSIILRFFSVYGPGQKKQVIYDLARKIHENPNYLEIYGDKDQSIDLIYIDDLINGIITAVKKGEDNGSIYNLASGKSIEIQKIIKIICQIYKIKPKINYLKETRSGANLKWKVDISKIKKLGFRPNTSLIQGLIKEKDWFDMDNNKDLKVK